MRVSGSESARLTAAIVGLFACNGLTVGAYVGSLPAVQSRFGLTPLAVAGILLGAGVCALLAMQLTGRWAERHGARRPSFVGPVIMAVGLLTLAFAPAYPVVLAGAWAYGFGNGMMDVAMNSLGVEVEQRLRRVRMGAFHGSWSLGTFAAAMLVVAFGPLSVHVWPPVLAGLALAGAAAVGVGRWAPETPRIEHHEAARTRLPRATWLLGVMAICFGFTEGTGFDWSSLHVAAAAHVPDNLATLGLGCMSGAMVIVRFLGDAIVSRWGRQRVVVVGSGVAAAGYLVTATASALPLLLAGWILVGVGCATLAPQIYGLAGHLGGPRMLSVVVGFGYVAFLACPAVVGAVAQHVGLQRTMVIPLAAAVVLVLLAWFMPAGPERD